MEEKLVIDRLPYPGLQVFDSTKCLQYFSRETILAEHFGTTNSEHWFDSFIFSQVHHLVNEPEALFYLMSVCPEKEVVDVCLKCWQQNTLTVSALHVVHVFLNWGATPESLGIQDDLQLASSFKPTLNPISVPNFPTPRNVKVVLDVISGCLSNEAGEDAERQRFNLVQVLVTASLDDKLCQHRFKFQQTICNVLETFQVWTFRKVVELVSPLQKMLLQNAAYVCCSLFVTLPRVHDLKVIAVRSLLHSRFNLLPPQETLNALLHNLPPPQQIMERYRLLEIYVLIQLLNTLLITCNNRPRDQEATCIITDTASTGSVEGLLKWTETVHSKLMTPSLAYKVEGGLVREKCVRLRADCKELIKNCQSLSSYS